MSEEMRMDAERAAFEAWADSQWPGAKRQQLKRDNYGEYLNCIYRDMWRGWQARAGLPVGVPDVLFDGFAVLSALPDKAKARTSAENVSDVLDAVVKILRAAPSAPAGEAENFSTTSDRYRAELYDEVWQKARDMGYSNVTEALTDLDRAKPAGEAVPVGGDSVSVPVIEAAAKFIEKRAEDYAHEHGHDDMGGLSFGQGEHARVKADYHSGLLELAEELRALLSRNGNGGGV